MNRPPSGPSPNKAQRQALIIDAAIDRLLADLKGAGLPPAAILQARIHFKAAREEIRAVTRLSLPEKS